MPTFDFNYIIICHAGRGSRTDTSRSIHFQLLGYIGTTMSFAIRHGFAEIERIAAVCEVATNTIDHKSTGELGSFFVYLQAFLVEVIFLLECQVVETLSEMLERGERLLLVEGLPR